MNSAFMDLRKAINLCSVKKNETLGKLLYFKFEIFCVKTQYTIQIQYGNVYIAFKTHIYLGIEGPFSSPTAQSAE